MTKNKSNTKTQMHKDKSILDLLRFRVFVSLCLLNICGFTLQAQVAQYPVQVFTQVTRSTPYLPEYYTGNFPKLQVTINNLDFQSSFLRVYLKMKIISNPLKLVTQDYFTPPMELTAGMPLHLSGEDLSVYFRPENLQISGNRSQFLSTQQLPDAFYTFHFEVYDYATGRLLSNPKVGSAFVNIRLGTPPVLNYPENGTKILESAIPNIMFSWRPALNLPAGYTGLEYEFTLVEIYDNHVNPEWSFDFSRVLYRETVRSTSFIHSITQPILQPGFRYAWRVRAISKSGIEEVAVIKNNGFSPVFWFDYASDCQPLSITAAIYENRVVNITWVSVPGVDSYDVQYRREGQTKWYTGRIVGGEICPIKNLIFGEEYEYRVGSRCFGNTEFVYTAVKSFRVPDEEEIRNVNCGLMPNSKIVNQTPTQQLIPGLSVIAGDFPVFITSVSGSGRFTGEGYVGIPLLKHLQVGVTFNNIVVNTDHQLISGFFETKYDEKSNNLLLDTDEYLTGGKGVGDIRSGEEKAQFRVDYTINPDIKAKPVKADGTADGISEGGGDYTLVKGENGKYTFVLTDSEGNEQKMETDVLPVTVEDKEGNTCEVNEKGEVKVLSKTSDISLDASIKDMQSGIAALSFRANGNTKYALDEYDKVYEKVTEYNYQYTLNGSSMPASAKFMLPGTSDEVEVYISENIENRLLPDRVRFITGDGKEYESKYNSGSQTWTLTVVAGNVNDGQEVYAVQEMGDGKTETLGKLDIYTYEPLERIVTLVPVKGQMNNLDKQVVQNGLNEIYGKVGIHWTVKLLEVPFSYTPKHGSAFNVTGSGLLSMFTDDMKAINEAFKQSGEYQEDGLYLFIIGDKAGESGTEGDMPLGSQFGYLFPNATIRTIAHEVGHGAFNLEHPFDRPGRNSFGKGDLNGNLMEYGTGRELVKLQWDQTRAPGHVIGLFQKDRSGMSAANNVNPKLQEKLNEIMSQLLAVGNNGCAFIQKKTSSENSVELNSTTSIEYLDYLIGKYENNRVTFDIVIEGKVVDVQTREGLWNLVNDKDNKNVILYVENGEVLGCFTTEDYSKFRNLRVAKDNLDFQQKYITDLLKCKCVKDADRKYILETLQKLHSYARANQEIEFVHNGIAYTLKDGEVSRSDLSDEDVNSGNWTDGVIDTKIRLCFDANGVVQVKAFGFRKDLKPADGKTANLPELASHIKEQTNKFLLENHVINFEQEAPVFKDDGEVFADGKQIVIGGKNAGYIKIVSEGVGITTTLLKTGEIEDQVYLVSSRETATIFAPGVLTGGVEVVAQKVTDLTSLATLVYDLAVDKEVRAQTYNQFKEIKNEIGEDPKNFIPIFVDVIVSVTTGNSAEEWKTTVESNEDSGKRSHLVTRGTGNAIMTIMAGAAIVKNLPEIAEKLAENIKKVKKAVKTFVDNPFDELGKLKKNIRYKTGEFEYFGETDHLGRLEKFDTESLQLTERGKRLPHNPDTPGKLDGDDAGHIFADRFGGSPELDNLVSQTTNVNRSKFATLENQWARAIENGQKVEVEIKINYEGDALRPSSFDIAYKIDGQPFLQTVIN